MEPVQQLPRKGRFPKAVACFRKAQREKEWAEFWEEEEKRKREIAKLDEAWWQALMNMERIEATLSRHGAVPTRLHLK